MQRTLPVAPRVGVWARPPLLWLRLAWLTALNALFSAAYRFVRSRYRLWCWSSRHYGQRLEGLARLHAYLQCAWAKKRVPAYGRFVDDEGYTWRMLALDSFPETSKDSYVARYGFAERCRGGRIPVGAVVDESAGSSGKPYNWVRSKRELHDVHVNTANWVRQQFPSEKLFAINAFSMGAWATGTNMGIALSQVAVVKSTGPDLEKIVDTIERFGAEFDYLIAAYPPFLKHVVDELDARGFDWSSVRVYGLVGGEGMTEAMRDHLERRLAKVRSGYGASDIQIGIAGETDLSVWVRKQLVAREDVRVALLGNDETRIPMVFQYNPLENYIEINANGEAVVTVNNVSVLSPKLRYNVGDEARIMTRDELAQRLGRRVHEMPDGWATPFLFLFGRRDSTISFMGANIYPLDVEYGLYGDERLAQAIESFQLAVDEHVVVHVQLRDGATIAPDAAETMRRGLVEHLAATSRDFAQSLREHPSAGELEVVLHEHGAGPFAGTRRGIKNSYVVRA